MNNTILGVLFYLNFIEKINAQGLNPEGHSLIEKTNFLDEK